MSCSILSSITAERRVFGGGEIFARMGAAINEFMFALSKNTAFSVAEKC